MRSAPLTIAAVTVILGVCSYFIWRATDTRVQPRQPTSHSSPPADPAPAAANPPHRREPDGYHEDNPISPQDKEGSDLVPGESTNNDQADATDPFPPEYTGIRDVNVVRLYKAFTIALKRQEEILATASEEALATGADENYHEVSAYLSLIQNQRLYYYGYEPAPMRPPNTDDAEYHLTGGGGMSLIFELTRTEFPDLFAAKDRRRKAAAGSDNGGR